MTDMLRHGVDDVPTLWEESSEFALSAPEPPYEHEPLLPEDSLTNLDDAFLAELHPPVLESYTEPLVSNSLTDMDPFAQEQLDLDLDLDPTRHSSRPRPQNPSAFQINSDDSSSSFSNETSQPLFGSGLSISGFSLDQQLMMSSNNRMASENLIQIYHDVLEHNLSCWITEMTCPYQPKAVISTQKSPEWGPSWCNRIYQRTVKLDQSAQSCSLVDLTRSESQNASKALNLAIMAFATQWAQNSPRHHEKFSLSPNSLGSSSHGSECGSTMSDEFDRLLQKNLWEQTKRALDQVAEVESYRVACAEIIFALTQKPWDSTKPFQDHSRALNSLSFALESVTAQLRDIIRKEGPPVYMERAARKMHALKFRYDAMEAGGLAHAHRLNRQMSHEDKVTIGLLYWLAIMFDTVSSSMNERPVVVLDQDCEMQSGQQPAKAYEYEERRWDLDLFTNRDHDEAHPTHWPCSYQEAAENVFKSAPVKVLLFRHLSYLQNVMRKGAPKKKIEEVIRRTTELYDYWNKTHGAFFRELVEDYDAVPNRIQGWFVCISAHWHLAALMVADLLEVFGDGNNRDVAEMHLQGYSQTAKRIRKHSTRELSDLARVGSPSTGWTSLGVPQMTDFHHAVNEGTLLTEPWTMILIRAFTKACIICLAEADGSLQNVLGQDGLDEDQNMKQAEYCIKGLWLLGKKSDMARTVANLLLLAFRRLQRGIIMI